MNSPRFLLEDGDEILNLIESVSEDFPSYSENWFPLSGDSYHTYIVSDPPPQDMTRSSRKLATNEDSGAATSLIAFFTSTNK